MKSTALAVPLEGPPDPSCLVKSFLGVLCQHFLSELPASRGLVVTAASPGMETGVCWDTVEGPGTVGIADKVTIYYLFDSM